MKSLDSKGCGMVERRMKTISAICLAGVLGFALQAAAQTKKADKQAVVDPAAFMTKFDIDRDAKLSKTELSAGLRSLKENIVTTQNDSWKKFDEDGDAKINPAELKKLLDENDKPPKVEPDAFLKQFDRNRDNMLDSFELNTGFKTLKPNSMTAKSDFWKKFDGNFDGKIDLGGLTRLLDEYYKQ